MADDLHKLVTHSSQQDRPFIMVGSEVGAMIARFYTQLYERHVDASISEMQGFFIWNVLNTKCTLLQYPC